MTAMNRLQPALARVASWLLAATTVALVSLLASALAPSYPNKTICLVTFHPETI